MTLDSEDLAAIVAAIAAAKPPVTLADGVTHGGPTAKLRLGSNSDTEPALHGSNSNLNGYAALLENSGGTGTAGSVTSVGSGIAMRVSGAYGNGKGLFVSGANAAIDVHNGNIAGAITQVGSVSNPVVASTVTGTVAN